MTTLWPDPKILNAVTDHQRAAAAQAMSSTVGMLNGAPGSGKTFTTAAIIKAILQSGHQSHEIAICAPTGAAAVRLTRAMRGCGLGMEATTIHRLLRVARGEPGEGRWVFSHHETNPLPIRFLVADEMSMVFTGLLKDLFFACRPGTHVLLVGDMGQLPPVEHGAPLRDLIDAGFPVGELTEIHRNAGTIVRCCHSIREGGPYLFDSAEELAVNAEPPRNLLHVKTRSPDASLRYMERLLANPPPGIDPIADIQVIVTVNEKSPLSRVAVNERIQNLLNPGDGEFRPRDKIMCTSNGTYPLADGEDETWEETEEGAYLANGEDGRVLFVDERRLVMRFEHPTRHVLVKGKERNKFTLGYARTAHKCVHPDTLVETPEGVKPICDISREGVIGTPNGARQFRNRVFFPARQCLSIGMLNGDNITVTRDHQCEAWRNGNYRMVVAEELKMGDRVRVALFPSIEPAENAIPPAWELARDPRCFDHHAPTVMTEDLAEFLGLMVADGCIYRSGFRLVKRHHDVVERFTELCFQLFGARNQEFMRPGAKASECASTQARDWLIKVGGCSPRGKHVPECVLRSRREIHRAFLRGLFEDGTVNIKQQGNHEVVDHVEWSSAYPRLNREVRFMLARLGIICGGRKRKRGSHGGRHSMLYIHGPEVAKFRDQIGFVSEFKNSRLKIKLRGKSSYPIPVSPGWMERHKHLLDKTAGSVSESTNFYQLFKKTGTLSIQTVRKLAELGLPEPMEWLRWHHTKITSMRHVECPAMCVEVPDGHKFMQNGFPWGNCQGMGWPIVIYLVDDFPGARFVSCRELVYTAISRAERLFISVGRTQTIHRDLKQVALSHRKTFLAELLKERMVSHEEQEQAAAHYRV